MASSYSDSLRLEKQGNGENDNAWGSRLNTVIDLVDAAVAGLASIATTGGTTVLTANNSSSDEARNAILKATGTLSSNAIFQIPAKTKVYTVWNATSGAYTLTVKTSGGTGVSVGQGAKSLIFCDGTDCYLIGTEAPAGQVIDFAGTSAPTGYLACDGSAVSRTTYAALFSAIGTTWGSGDGSTTFNLPDHRGRTAIGSGTGSGLTARTVGTQNIGSEAHALSTAELATHSHSFSGTSDANNRSHTHTPGVVYNGSPGSAYASIAIGGYTDIVPNHPSEGESQNHTHTFSGTTNNNGSGTAHQNMQPSLVMLKCIKY